MILLKNQVSNEFALMYLIIFLIPLTRIIPRLVRKYRGKSQTKPDSFIENKPNQKREYTVQDNTENQIQTNDMKVTNELNRGTTTFEKIQKNTGIDSKELDTILEDLEKRGLMKVIRKQGLFGPKIELHTTKDLR